MSSRIPQIAKTTAWALVAVFGLAGCASGATGKRVGFPWPPLAHTLNPVSHEGVETLAPVHDRDKSRVLVRAIRKPTRANLDYAAYFANPMLATPPELDPGTLAGKPPRGKPPFEGVLEPGSMVGTLTETPLRNDELARAMAFSPLVDYLSRWNPALASNLEDVRTAVRTESWGKPKSMQHTFQEIASVFWHVAGPGEPDPGLQWWVEVEFQPWATLFWDMPDGDGDGYPEMYGRLRPELVTRELEARVREDYLGRELSGREVSTWLNELASYWYPSYNTDIAVAGREGKFPDEQTEPEIVAALNGFWVEGMLFALRGKPQGELIYNVFVVDGVEPVEYVQAPIVDTSKRRAISTFSMAGQMAEALRIELDELGSGAFDSWAERLAPVHKQLRKMLTKRPERLKAFVGKEGWLFFRGSLRYVVGGDLGAQAPGKNPLPAIVSFKNGLAAQGVDFLLVTVPSKLEVYPDKLVKVGRAPNGEQPVMNPYGRKLLLELAEAGVESVDLLPLLLAERAGLSNKDEDLYLKQDTHWSRRGLALVARAVAARVERYPWFAELGDRRNYTRREVSFQERGDLVSRLAPAEARRYKPVRLMADQVVDEAGQVYDDDPASPIVVLGDSFTGVYERTFTTGAGISAQLAAQLGHPVDLVMSYGGGPNVRKALLRRGLDDLSERRLVIWMFAARDLYNYYEDWDIVSFE